MSRAKPYRANPTPAFMNNFDRAMSERFFLVNENYKAFIRLDKFNDSSIDILVYCFTSTNDWEVYLEIKEKLASEIKSKVEEFNLNFAFPSQSIYIEKNN